MRKIALTLYFPISRYKVEQCPNSIYFSKYAIFQKIFFSIVLS